jgi:exoribonuclease-2
MEPGYLVEFFEQKRILCALVLELKGERLHVLTQTNREMTVARKRVLHACPGPSPAQMSRRQLLDLLEETARRREAWKAGILLEDLWELLAQENHPLPLAEMAELWFGTVLPDQVAALGRVLLEDRLLFKYKEGLWVPNPLEVVAALQEQHQREVARQQELEEVAAWLRAVWDGEATGHYSWQPRLVDLLRQIALWGAQAPDYEQAKEYLEQAGLTKEDAPFRLLVRLGIFQEDENLDLYRLEVPLEFPPPVRVQAGQLNRNGRPDPYEAHRLDLTHLECLTIDGERTRDLTMPSVWSRSPKAGVWASTLQMWPP